MKGQNHKITVTERAFDHIQHPFMIKTISTVGIEGSYLKIIKAIYDKSIANIISNGQTLKSIFPKIKTAMSAFITVIQHSIGSPSHSHQTRKRSKRHLN